MSIGINAENLATEGLALEIAGGAGGDIRIVLGQSGGLTGRYEQDAGRITLGGITAHQLSLQSLVLPVAGGTLRADSPSILGGLSVDAELGGGRPFTGRVGLASAGAHVSFERGPVVARARLSLRGTLYERSVLAGQRAEIESLEVEASSLKLPGDMTLHIERLSLRGVVCSVEPNGVVALRCGSAHAASITVEQQGGRSLQLRGLAWPNGIELHGDMLRWPELALERLQLALPDLPRRSMSTGSLKTGSPKPERAGLDLPLLDHLEGLLAFDLFVDVRIPILPDRRVTHSIRVPITHGAINFKELEACFAGLENALFDFAVNEEGLNLELDPIPHLTIDNLTLVTWPLAGDDHSLAEKQQKVRLRRLLDYRLSSKLAGSGEQQQGAHSNGPLSLRRLRVGDIDTVLRLAGPVVQPLPGLGTLRLGAPGQPAAGELKLSGQLEHTPGAPASATELRLDARDLLLGASMADDGGRRVEIERLVIGGIDGARLGLLGVEPRSASLDAARLRLSGVELRGWFARR
jgi:hypothetical protein